MGFIFNQLKALQKKKVYPSEAEILNKIDTLFKEDSKWQKWYESQGAGAKKLINEVLKKEVENSIAIGRLHR